MPLDMHIIPNTSIEIRILVQQITRVDLALLHQIEGRLTQASRQALRIASRQVHPQIVRQLREGAIDNTAVRVREVASKARGGVEDAGFGERAGCVVGLLVPVGEGPGVGAVGGEEGLVDFHEVSMPWKKGSLENEGEKGGLILVRERLTTVWIYAT